MNLLIPDSGLLFWMIVSMAIVFGILLKWGFPVIIKMVDKRNARIADSLAKAEEARKYLDTIKEQGDAIINAAKEENSKMLHESMVLRQQLLDKAKSDAQDESKQIISSGRKQIEQERNTAMAQIREQVALLSVDVAEAILREKLSDDRYQQEYILKLIDEIKQQPKDKKS